MVAPVSNFSANEYRAANQNWDIAIDDDGLVFVANHQGLLTYNGQHWRKYELPERTIIRSVHADGKRVYTGSYEEFGYWEKNAYGQYGYTSLTGLIPPEHELNSEEFWEIIRWGNYIVFRSFTAVYLFDGSQIEVLDPDVIITKILAYGDRLLMGAGTGEVYSYSTEDGMEPVPGTSAIGNPVADMAVLGHRIIIGTKSKGCYIYSPENGTLNYWQHPLSARLEEDELNKLCVTGKNSIAFGTIKNGVILYDFSRDKSSTVNRHLGLQNNTVLGMYMEDGDLWLALDNGIDMIDIQSEFVFFKEDSGELGTVYDLAFYNGNIYLGSNTGVYYFQNGEMVFMENSQGHVWDLEVVEGRLLCGHNSGIYDISENRFEKISNAPGGYAIRKIPDMEHTYIWCSYIGLSLLEYKAGHWEERRIDGITFPVDHIEFEDRNTVWASHPYKGFFRIRLDEEYRRALSVEDFEHPSMNGTGTRIFRIGDDITFYNEGNWYAYNPDSGTIENYVPFRDYRNRKLLFQDGSYYWFTDTRHRGVLYTDMKRDTLIVQQELRQRLTPQFEKMIKQDDSLYYFTLNDGFARFNLSRFRELRQRHNAETVGVDRVETADTLYDFTGNAGIPFKQASSLRFFVYYPRHAGQDFGYELSGPMAQRGIAQQGVLTFQNLTYGDYTLRVWPVALGPGSEAVLEYVFEIHPPWYLSVWMRGCYLLMFLLLLYAIYLWNRKLIREQQRKLVRRMYRESQAKVEMLERKNLEQEVRMKRKELMNSTLMISKKNELLLEIQNELRRINRDNVNEYRVKSLIARTGEAIHNQEDWQVFETNFNQLHEDFFKRLVNRFPKLTSKDIKLCGYLKMNLTSKEIAPLMGITTRGVEIHRYRMRKKLSLDKNQDLVKFLLNI
ncbi:Two component regulator three Y domain-containing protein [Sinomicrobium soli]|nr:Two component regulator three Y domain-containing protein [Sinomicrobium sp. N-1-3-6]